MNPQIQKEISNKYLRDLTGLVAPGSVMSTAHGKVTHHRGLASNIEIDTPDGTIDFSEEVGGEPLPGFITTVREPDHTDERDYQIIERYSFPRHEGDIAFMEGLLKNIKENRN